MGRFCAWCGSVMRGRAGSQAPPSHPICAGCVQELEATLARAGLRLAKQTAVAARR